MAANALQDLPATARELQRSCSGVICKRAAGMAQGWDIPVFEWHYKQGCEQTISAHDESVLSIFAERSLLKRVDGRMTGLQGGDRPASIALAHGGSRRTYVALRSSLVTHFYLSRAFLARLIAETEGKLIHEPADRIFCLDPRVAQAARDYATRAFDSANPPMALEMNARSVLLAIEILRAKEPTSDPVVTLNKHSINLIATLVEDKLSEPITLGDMAAEIDYSISHFLLMFKNTFGVTPHRFIVTRRIERAKQLLTRGCAPLSQIALECGFASQQHFSTLFRRATGVTPSAFRLNGG
jgi:AraC family transcriptional regulator